MTTEAGNYAASARINENSPWQHVTLGRQLFFANKGLIDIMVEAMKVKHPTAEFRIEKVR